jgi:hypothetical protein
VFSVRDSRLCARDNPHSVCQREIQCQRRGLHSRTYRHGLLSADWLKDINFPRTVVQWLLDDEPLAELLCSTANMTARGSARHVQESLLDVREGLL